jgi:hypothetical protein
MHDSWEANYRQTIEDLLSHSIYHSSRYLSGLLLLRRWGRIAFFGVAFVSWNSVIYKSKQMRRSDCLRDDVTYDFLWDEL